MEEKNKPKIKDVKSEEIKEKKTTKKVKEKSSKKPNKKPTPSIAKAKKDKKSKLEKKGKKYQKAFLMIEKDKEYELDEAIALVRKTSFTKFDSSVEVHVALSIDPKNPDHQIRGSVSLPAGLGIKKKVAVVCDEVLEKEAKKAGADIVGGKDLIAEILKGKIDFNVLVSTPSMMGELSKAGKVLGPKGLMPNPKDNTVTEDIKKAVTEIKKGRAEYRADTYGIVHVVIGKVSFEESSLIENFNVFLAEIERVKPVSVKSGYVKKIYLTTTMGPSIKIKK